jgi:uridylate kinase
VHKKSPKKSHLLEPKKTLISLITSLTNTKKKRKESVFPPLPLPQKELPLFLSLSLCVVVKVVAYEMNATSTFKSCRASSSSNASFPSSSRKAAKNTPTKALASGARNWSVVPLSGGGGKKIALTARANQRGGGVFETSGDAEDEGRRRTTLSSQNLGGGVLGAFETTAKSSSFSSVSSTLMSKNKKATSDSEDEDEGKTKGKDATSLSSKNKNNNINNKINKNKNMSDDECETTPANAKWKRVMLKISGEALSGSTSKDGQNFGLDPRVVERIAGEIVAASMSGVEIAVVVGGGNFFRGASHEGAHLDRASADYMGMLATVMNAISLQGAIEAKGVQTRVLSALSIKEVAEPYIRRRAMRHLEKGRVVIFGAGTGNPFFTTDTGAALRAAEINAQVVLKATKVDGVFCSDPKQNVNAKKYERLSYETVQRLGLGVMDQTAITMCRENDLPIVVFDMTKGGNIHKAIRGQAGVGTCISDSDEKCP